MTMTALLLLPVSAAYSAILTDAEQRALIEQSLRLQDENALLQRQLAEITAITDELIAVGDKKEEAIQAEREAREALAKELNAQVWKSKYKSLKSGVTFFLFGAFAGIILDN